MALQCSPWLIKLALQSQMLTVAHNMALLSPILTVAHKMALPSQMLTVAHKMALVSLKLSLAHRPYFGGSPCPALAGRELWPSSWGPRGRSTWHQKRHAAHGSAGIGIHILGSRGINVNTFTYIYIHICICVYVYHVHMYLSIHIYIYTYICCWLFVFLRFDSSIHFLYLSAYTYYAFL